MCLPMSAVCWASGGTLLRGRGSSPSVTRTPRSYGAGRRRDHCMCATDQEMLISPERYLAAELLHKAIGSSSWSHLSTVLASYLPESEVQSLASEYSSLMSSLDGSDDQHPELYSHLITIVRGFGLQPSTWLLSEECQCLCTPTERTGCTMIRERRKELRRIRETSHTSLLTSGFSPLYPRYDGDHEG